MYFFSPMLCTQHDGVATGCSPLGPTLANTFMVKIISKVQNKTHYFMYVDNCFVIPKITKAR